MRGVDVKQTRRKLRLNQVEFAQLIGVHPITVSKWERGEAIPTPHQTALFAEFNTASRDKEVRNTIRNVLISAGVALALALLLKHLIRKK